MKIKTDFVTNSSSTAYVVFIPDNFYIDEDEVEELYKGFFEIYHEASEEDLYKTMPDCVEELKEGKDIWYYGEDGVNQTVFNIIYEICKKHGFLLAEMEMNGEGNNTMKGVSQQTIETTLINSIDLMSTFNQLQKRGQHVNEKTE